MADPDLTMALCAYGDNPFLENSIKSLKAQTVPVRLYIATSTPSAYIKQLAEKYQIGYFVNPLQGGGIGADWEFAASCAETKYVTIAHQDDYYTPEYAENILKTFQKYPESLIVFTDFVDLINGKIVGNRSYLWIKRFLLWAYYLKPSWNSKVFKMLPSCFGNAICCPSAAYNLGKTGELKFDRSYVSNLDWAKWIELAKMDGAFSFVPKRLMAHRIDPTTATSALIQDNRRYREDFRIFSEIWGHVIAGFLMKFYSKSYKMANVKKEKQE